MICISTANNNTCIFWIRFLRKLLDPNYSYFRIWPNLDIDKDGRGLAYWPFKGSQQNIKNLST